MFISLSVVGTLTALALLGLWLAIRYWRSTAK